MTHSTDSYEHMLGYLAQYQGETIAFKIGGETIDAPERLNALTRQILLLNHFGIQCLLTHGGGKQLTAAQEKEGIQKQVDQDGDRITDALTLKITKQVMRELNETILQAFDQAEKELQREFDQFEGCNRVGMRQLRAPILARPKTTDGDNFTGIPTGCDTSVIEPLLNARKIVILSCLAQSYNSDGQVYNVNGDRAVLALADKVKAKRLVFVTDVPGVMTTDRKQLFSALSTSSVYDLIADGTAQGGMAMKLSMAAEAVDQGNIGAVVLQQAGATLQELLTDSGGGTMIKPNGSCPAPIMVPVP